MSAKCVSRHIHNQYIRITTHMDALETVMDRAQGQNSLYIFVLALHDAVNPYFMYREYVYIRI